MVTVNGPVLGAIRASCDFHANGNVSRNAFFPMLVCGVYGVHVCDANGNVAVIIFLG